MSVDTSKHALDSTAYTSEFQDVVKSEIPYLKERRALYNQQKPGDTDTHLEEVWGLAISGGGIRSATLALGMMQKFIVEGIFKRFDYMSTVSGGGYMGACLSSLMNNKSSVFVQPQHLSKEIQETQIPGLDIETSPFVKLIDTLPSSDSSPDPLNKPLDFSHTSKKETRTRWAPSEMRPYHGVDEAQKGNVQEPELDMRYHLPENTRLDVRHQIHHLRTHGEYLTPDKRLFSPDVQRAIGTVFAGILHNLFLFALFLTGFVAINFISLDLISDGDFVKEIQEKVIPAEPVIDPNEPASIGKEVSQQLAILWTDKLVRFFGLIFEKMNTHWQFGLSLVTIGIIISIYFMRRCRLIARRMTKDIQSIAEGTLESPSHSGHSQEQFHETRFTQRFNLVSIGGGIILAIATWFYGKQTGAFTEVNDYWVIFSLPFAFSLGLFLGIYTVIPFISYTPKQNRLHRSLHGELRGGALYSLAISAIMPILILVLFTFSFFFDEVFVSLFSSISSVASIGVGYFAMNQTEGGKGIVDKIIQQVKMPILSLSVFLFVGLVASLIARTLTLDVNFQGEPIYFPIWLLIISTLLFILVGVFINSNKLSLHYFYRDRLSEAYLKTDGRVLRKDNSRQGMPLMNLRNNENMAIKNLGYRKLRDEKLAKAKENPSQNPTFRYDEDGTVWEPNPRSPYHIIVTALNLQGSDELIRKDLKSEHFTFSRNYVGAQSTGYVKTSLYRQGRTKLARAIAISAAAVGSGMGFSTFFAQSFITTLLNLRLGYWVENPWFYRNSCDSQWLDSWFLYQWRKLRGWSDSPIAEGEEAQGKYKIYYNPKRRYTFWPYYLFLELMGMPTANQRLINVSDGGHTGDNLGLFPLLKRRCKQIVVCDFEEDKEFGFESFNHVVRMAHIEENIEIAIDLRPLVPIPIKDLDVSKIGVITPSSRSVAVGKVFYPDNTEGTIYYIKSSINQERLPVNVFNYHKLNPGFPHQSTADQYFDDSQFEAYRSLGAHMADQASKEIYNQLKKNS